ncbi:MAG: undecaprenyl/decaprenyl-phosphate alpha-N-acetylglucosaminyl 1-phosphate transferase [Clostridia bacterium]|nr:undecaprenyl/decaprenyl-phosphate alpha-N-acetylglucosaminyl 1-phosphate transferase [Clostridia bacterium]
MNTTLIYGIVAVICSALLAYALTPPIRVLAYKIGAIDVPTDGRRMHTRPTPRLGGLAIFFGFVVTSLLFCEVTPSLVAIWIGGLILCTLGTLDDIFRLHWLVKMTVQFAVAGIAISQGVLINQINLGGSYVQLGVWSYPITLLWIVGLTNAINLIDGLDGLACGVSAISSLSILCVMLLLGDAGSALITGILAGACIGFLPFNRNPARIFMGDSGALFLGYTFALISIEGVFKLHTILSFMIPLSIFAFPILDTLTAIVRRLLHGKNPFAPDRSHLHHKLIDLGFTQKETVGILYAICGILGLVAVTFTETMFPNERLLKSVLLAAAALIIFWLNYIVMKNPSTRYLSGLFDPSEIPPEQISPTKKGDPDEETQPTDEAAESPYAGISTDETDNK